MDCKIRIKTVQRDYKGMSIFERAAYDLMIEENFSLLDEEGVIESILFGKLTQNGDECTLTYNEEDRDEMFNTSTKLTFKTATPDNISLIRTGTIDTFMYFEGGKRHLCVYNTGIMPFEVCIFTKSVKNKLLEDGTLEIKYLVEIKGACAQETTLKLEIEKV